MDLKLLTGGKLLLGIFFSIVIDVKCSEVSAVNAFLPPLTNDEINTQFQQAQPMNFFHTAQSLPFNNPTSGFTNAAQYQGYNYQTPASIYNSYSAPVTGTHKTQTPPLALSLHPDDYEKFDKKPQTFFVPRSKKILSSSTKLAQTRTQDEFYVPRANFQQNKVPEEDSVEHITFPLSPESSSSATQQNRKPLLAAPDSSTDLQAQTNLNDQSNVGMKAFRNSVYAQQNVALLPTSVSVNSGARVSDITNLRNQRTRTNFKTDVTTPKQTASQPIECSTYVKESNQAPEEHLQFNQEAFKQASIVSSFQEYNRGVTLADVKSVQPTGNSPNQNGFYLTDSERQQRIETLKTLLAEYLALTLPEAPQAIGPNINYEQADKNNFSLSRNSIPSSSNTYNSAFQYQNLPRHQPPIFTQVRRPHLAYGAPYTESLNSNLEASQTLQPN